MRSSGPHRSDSAISPLRSRWDRWYTFIRQAPEETYAPIYSLLLTVGMIGFGLVIVLSGLGFVVGSRIVKPITALQRSRRTTPHFGHTGTPTLPTGHPALPHGTERAIEIEDLAATFRHAESSWKKTSARSDLNSMN